MVKWEEVFLLIANSMAKVPALNLLAISAIEILAMDCMAPSLAL